MNHLRKGRGPARSARAAACQALLEIFGDQAYANITIGRYLSSSPMREEERRFFTELVYGVTRRYNHLIWIISRLSSRPPEKLDMAVRIVLCLGLYQLIYLDHVPESAAVNESVKLIKEISHEGNGRFVNAILRNYLRKKENLKIPSREEDEILHLSLSCNEPEWLIRCWAREWGMEKAESVCRALNEIPETDVRCNTLKTTVPELLDILRGEDPSAGQIPGLPEGIRMGRMPSLRNASWLHEGLGYIQNASSMLPARVLAPQPGEHILDMCAAPGSKTTHMAQLMENRGQITAWDLYPHKLRLLEENCRRLGISIVKSSVRDASRPDPSLTGAFDRVLLDAPCSGLGVLGHKPEMRWTRKEKDLAEFPKIQKNLLRAAALYVRPGGVLVYSTCTLNKGENEDTVKKFLAEHTEFSLAPFSFPADQEIKSGMMTVWPDICRMDGFFAAKLIKEK